MNSKPRTQPSCCPLCTITENLRRDHHPGPRLNLLVFILYRDITLLDLIILLGRIHYQVSFLLSSKEKKNPFHPHSRSKRNKSVKSRCDSRRLDGDRLQTATGGKRTPQARFIVGIENPSNKNSCAILYAHIVLAAVQKCEIQSWCRISRLEYGHILYWRLLPMGSLGVGRIFQVVQKPKLGLPFSDLAFVSSLPEEYLPQAFRGIKTSKLSIIH